MDLCSSFLQKLLRLTENRLPETTKVRTGRHRRGRLRAQHARVYRDLAQKGEVEFVGIVDFDYARATAIAAGIRHPRIHQY